MGGLVDGFLRPISLNMTETWYAHLPYVYPETAFCGFKARDLPRDAQRAPCSVFP